MLQIKTVEPNTLAVLKQLMQIPELQQFSLVGGTALALKYGHRISIDLDLFSEQPFDFSIVLKALESEFDQNFLLDTAKANFGIFCFIKDIKVDFVKHPLKLLRPIEIEDNIRLYSSPDIAAMKINAILGRGKKKDFGDLIELLQYYSLKEIINFYADKFPEQRLAIGIHKAVTYFTDAEDSEDPVSLKGQTWQQVKKDIQKKVSDYLK